MKKILESLRTHKYAIIWTLCYVVAMWAILYFLFKFNMFNGAQWHRLFNSQLRGFPGFVFGILILSALPLYVATTTLVIRKKAPLVTIPVPKIPSLKKPYPTPAPTADTTPGANQDKQEPSPEMSPDIPPELHAAFIRARQLVHANMATNTSTQSQENIDTGNNIANLSTITPQNQTPTTDNGANTNEQINDDFPLPSDFDIAFDDRTNIPGDFTPMSAPIFKEVSFDDNTPAPDTIIPDTATQSTQTTPDVRPDISSLTEYLEHNNHNFQVDNDIVITDTHAIATHSDPDFWVVDAENWFAAGKVRQSPITDAVNMAQKHKKTPAIYLASQNILDIDSLKQTWTSDGIAVITEPSEL